MVTPGHPPLPRPTASLFTDGSASKALGTAGWGVQICHHHSDSIVDLWGPVVSDRSDRAWVGALRAASNTAELSAFYHALLWILSSRPSGPTPPRSFNVLTDLPKI